MRKTKNVLEHFSFSLLFEDLKTTPIYILILILGFIIEIGRHFLLLICVQGRTGPNHRIDGGKLLPNRCEAMYGSDFEPER